METRPPLPPFTAETAAQKVRAAENAWNTRDAQRAQDLDYRLIKELWAFTEDHAGLSALGL